MNKYSNLLKEEAVRLCREVSVRKAAKITGVHWRTVQSEWDKWRTKHAPQSFKKSAYPRKYTSAQKIACVKLAIKYIDTGHITAKKIAFVAAGKRLNINGLSIYQQWVENNIRGVTNQPIQQPGTGSPVVSGASIHAANPQSQRCAEQPVEAFEMRPAPKIIKRRKFTSETMPKEVLRGHRSQMRRRALHFSDSAH